MQINGFPVERKKLEELTKAPYNPRKISPEMASALKRSLQEFGNVEPIIWNKQTGHIVGGHQRFDALLSIGETETDVVIVDMPEEREQALNIALNKISGDWNFGTLSDILLSLHDDMRELTGFTEDEIAALFPKQDIEAQNNEECEALLNKEWSNWAGDVILYKSALSSVSVLSANATRSVGKIKFLRSLYYADEYPRWCFACYHANILDVAGDKRSITELLQMVSEDESKSPRLRFILGDENNFDKFYRSSLSSLGARIPNDFPATLAKDLINEFCIDGGKVLDPCHGWGGRAVGFLLSNAKEYVGFDPSETTHNGTSELFADYSQFVSGKIATFNLECFEDSSLKDCSFDFAITSPPYYDVEKYDGEMSSHRRYNSFDSWCDSFYAQLIQKTYKALKPFSVFALQVGSQSYPLVEKAKDIASDVGFIVSEIRHTEMVNNFNKTQKDDGEVVLILKKNA